MNYPAIIIVEAKNKLGYGYLLKEIDENGKIGTTIFPFFSHEGKEIEKCVKDHIERGFGAFSYIWPDVDRLNSCGKDGWVEIAPMGNSGWFLKMREIATQEMIDYIWNLLDDEKKAPIVWNRIIFPDPVYGESYRSPVNPEKP